MSRALFVSDIHISSAADPKAGLFLRFLDACARARVDDLFLVGDIFDLWISDRSFFTREYQEIIVKIRQLVSLGIRVHYFEGNHDLDLRRFWQHDVGCNVQSEAAYFYIGNYRVRVEHGDQMDPSDRGYLFLRWLLRTPFVVFLCRYLPNFFVARVGRGASQSSREYTTTTKSATDEEVRAKIHAHALRAYMEQAYDILVSGHVHVAEDFTEERGGAKIRVINLGTWLKKPILFDINNNHVELRTVDEFIAE